MARGLGYKLAELEQEIESIYLPVLLKAVRKFDAEWGHNLAIYSLLAGVFGGHRPWQDDPALQVKVNGLKFPNPIGIGAGFDKNALVIKPLAATGFGFVEVGTVTPKPQKGNSKPRLFRLIEDQALINRMGFNNDGIRRVVLRLARLHQTNKIYKTQANIPVGLNIGINKIGADPERDYPAQIGMARFFVDYIVLNLSSPNTPGLRDLQKPARLKQIVTAIQEKQPNHPPLFVKLAPDLSEEEVEAIVDTVMNARIAGLVLTNTTIHRPDHLQAAFRYEPGGLSGRPLLQKSTEMLARVARQTKGQLTLIGCGGIASGQDVLDKILHGADLTQLYTSFAYEGPVIIRRIKKELSAILQREGIENITELKGQAL